MMRAVILFVQVMILVHSLDDREVALNMEYVVSIARPGELTTEKSNCLIHFSNGHFVNTKETCREISILWQREDAKVK